MKNRSKILMVLVAVALLASCNKVTTTPESTDTGPAYDKYDPPITLTTTRTVTSADQMDAWKANPYIVWCEEKLGIIWEAKYVAASEDEHVTQLTLLAASNDLPDVLADGSEIFPTLYKSGNIRVIEDDINQYGSPMVKGIFTEYKETLGVEGVANKTNPEGKLYCIPHVLDPTEAGAYETLYIRMDITEDLGFDKPTTLPELEELMGAYKAAYPDEFPYRTEASTYGTSGMIFSLFGVSPGWFYDPEGDGTYTYGAIEPGMKNAIAKLAEWYKKGWMDPYYHKISAGDYNTQFVNGQGLINAGMGWFANWAQTQLSLNSEDAYIEPLGFLKGTEGNEDYSFRTWLPTGWPAAMSTNCEHPEAVIMEMNELYESVMRNDPDMRAKYGNKYPVTEIQSPLNQEAVDAGTAVPEFNYSEDEIGPGFFNYGTQTNTSPVGVHLYGDSTVGSTSKNSKATLEAFLANNRDLEATKAALKGTAYETYFTSLLKETAGLGQELAVYSKLTNLQMLGDNIASGKIKHLMNSREYSDAGIQSLIDYGEALGEMEKQYFNDIVRGVRPLDDWDKMIEQWKSNGGSKILEEIDAYWAAK
ncbi:MAG: type 2 periplasmic-binding domain-containing protein [Saccharofermentanales bacterium]